MQLNQGTEIVETLCERLHKEETCAAHKPICAVVYLHGLCMDAHESDNVVEAVRQLYGNQVINIQPTCREGNTSARLSIEKQAKMVVAEIKKTLRAEYPNYTEQDFQDLPINIFGYSQGGQLACILADSYKSVLNIKTVTAAHSPLSGTPALENNLTGVHQFIKSERPGLETIGYNTHCFGSWLRRASMYGASVMLNGRGMNHVARYFVKGLRDMFQDSECIQLVKTFVRGEHEGRALRHSIPILLIAGYISNLAQHFDFDENDEEKVRHFNDAYSLLTTKKEGGEHDILVPVRSQLCRTDSFENLSSSVNDPVYPPNVEIYIAEDELHCYNLMSMLSDFPVKHGRTLFESKATINAFTDFLRKHNNIKVLVEEKC